MFATSSGNISIARDRTTLGIYLIYSQGCSISSNRDRTTLVTIQVKRRSFRKNSNEVDAEIIIVNYCSVNILKQNAV